MAPPSGQRVTVVGSGVSMLQKSSPAFGRSPAPRLQAPSGNWNRGPKGPRHCGWSLAPNPGLEDQAKPPFPVPSPSPSCPIWWERGVLQRASATAFPRWSHPHASPALSKAEQVSAREHRAMSLPSQVRVLIWNPGAGVPGGSCQNCSPTPDVHAPPTSLRNLQHPHLGFESRAPDRLLFPWQLHPRLPFPGLFSTCLPPSQSHITFIHRTRTA